MYYWTYRLGLGTVFLLMGAALIIWAAALCLIKKYSREKQIFCSFVTLIVILLMVYYTLVERTSGPNYQMILRPLASFDMAKIQPEIYREMTMNVFLFFPFGLFLPQALPKKMTNRKKFFLTVLAGLLFSVFIEAMQLLLMRGNVETDDVITNTLGAMIGALHLPLSLPVQKLLPIAKKE